MRLRVMWLLLVVGLLGAACQAVVEPTPAPCDFSGQTAVILTLEDEAGVALPLVAVSYRQEDGPWQALPERVNGRAVISGGPGTYQLRAEKTGYGANELVVTVPAPAGCQLAAAQATLVLAPAVCPTTPLPVTLTLLTPAGENEDLLVQGITPEGGVRLDCHREAGQCRYDLPLGRTGSYGFNLSRLPAIEAMVVTEDVVGYEYAPFALAVGHNLRRQEVTGEGAEQVALTFPVAGDEVGCPVPDLRRMTVSVQPDVTGPEPGPPPSVALNASLLLTDLGAAECQVAPVLTPLLYEVTLPAGTRLSQTEVQYLREGAWQAAECALAEGRYQCTAQLPNPLLRQPYAVRVVIDGVAYVDTQLPFDNLCLVFR